MSSFSHLHFLCHRISISHNRYAIRITYSQIQANDVPNTILLTYILCICTLPTHTHTHKNRIQPAILLLLLVVLLWWMVGTAHISHSSLRHQFYLLFSAPIRFPIRDLSKFGMYIYSGVSVLSVRLYSSGARTPFLFHCFLWRYRCPNLPSSLLFSFQL